MITTIVKPTKAEITLPIPEKYVGKEVELIAFIKEEAENNPEPLKIPFTMLASEESLGKIGYWKKKISHGGICKRTSSNNPISVFRFD